MWFIGLDYHSKTSDVCILDENGKMVKRTTVRGGWRELLEVLRALKQPFAVCYEASCGYGHLYDQLKPIAKRIAVAHPGHLRMIFRSKRKNDRVDAEKLARLLFLEQVPVVHVPTVEVRSWRSLIEFRHRLIAKRTRVKNSLRALLRHHGVEAPARKRLWTKKGLEWLKKVELPASLALLQRDVLLDELQHLEGCVKRVERELNAIAQAHPGVHLLRTIPGVGPRTAEAVLAYIDEAGRFSRNKQVGCYFGLVPCQDQSAGTNRFGHITQEGPATVRKLLVEAAWRSIRKSQDVRKYFERIMGTDQDRKKIALVATAHYLVRIMHAMLRTGEVWRGDDQRRPSAETNDLQSNEQRAA